MNQNNRSKSGIKVTPIGHFEHNTPALYISFLYINPVSASPLTPNGTEYLQLSAHLKFIFTAEANL